MRKISSVSILLLLTSIFNCNNSNKKSESQSLENSVPSVTVQQLKREVDSGNDVFLLDVRTQSEFIQSRLSFTDLRIPYDSLNVSLDRLPKDKTTRIYSFCRSGRRSEISARYLESIGYTNVYNVTGGMLAWEKAGFETVGGK